jgi:hypothetical protein
MTLEQKPKKRAKAYSFTQAIYQKVMPENQPKPRIGIGLFLLILLVAVVVLHFLLKLL